MSVCFLACLCANGRAASGHNSTTTAAVNPVSLRANIRLTSYVLASGDRLSLLAERYGIENDRLIRRNPGLKTTEMKIGDVIVLPLPRRTRLPRTELAKDIQRGIRGRGRVALTFDLGADDGALGELLAVLRDRGVRTTFFATGRWAEKYPDDVRRIARAGHEILNHSYSHRPFTDLDPEDLVEELEKADRIIHRLTGRRPLPYYRPPYGDYDKRVLAVAAESGWQCVYWTLDAYDAVGQPKSPQYLVRRILSAGNADDPRRALDGAIVLFHAAKPATARALWPILDGLALMDLEPVPLTTLLRPE